jgi:glycosyltransferase involved in cell wall biosynthesis
MNKPGVTIIVPCRNEEQHIERFIHNIIDQDYPKENLQVLIIDGMSEDSTTEIIKKYSSQYNFIKLIKNEKKFVPHGLNKAIKLAQSEFIVRMDVHSSYPENYISELIRYMIKLNADNAGGVVIAKPIDEKSPVEQCIAHILAHPFGVGNSLFRTYSGKEKIIKVDTVPFGCYRRNLFEKIGYFNENLIRNQDYEFNQRLKQAGGKIYLITDLKVYYHPRRKLLEYLKNMFMNGKWGPLTVYYSKNLKSLSLRHFIPMFFTLYIILSPLLSSFSYWFLIPLFLYLIMSFLVAFSISIKQKSPFYLCLPILFFLTHLSYGMGSLFGIIKIIIGNNDVY